MHRIIIALFAAAWLTAALPSLSAQSFEAVRHHPLSAAHQTLRARTQVLQHKHAEAAAPLSTAADALAFVEQTDHADAVDYIDAWLNQVELLKSCD